MSHLLDSKRVVQMDARESGSLLFSLKFSCTGELLEGSCDDKDLLEKLTEVVKEQPLLSQKKKVEFELNGKTHKFDMNCYIDCVAGELPDILAEAYPDNQAIDDPTAKVVLTYNDLYKMSSALAKSLINMGIKKGEHVAILMNNCWEQIIVKFALAKAGAVADNISYHEKKDGLKDQMLGDECVAAFIKQGINGKEHMDMFYQISPEILSQNPYELKSEALPDLRFLVVTDPNKPRVASIKLQDLIKAGEALSDDLLTERAKEISPFDPVTIIHTSGSTGKPKSVVLGNTQIIENAISHIEIMKMTDKDRLCMTPPMFHAFGAVGSMLTTLLAGACLICYDNAGDISLFDTLVNEKVTVLCSVPIIYVRLCDTIRKKNGEAVPDTIRLCVTAGAPCPPALVEDINKIIGAKDVVGMYGMTETSPGLCSHVAGDPIEVISNTVGRFWRGVEYKIVNSEGELQIPMRPGEICVRGYMVMQGYYKNPEETANLIDKYGWVHTGDLGYIREDGNLTLKGRIKDLIIRGGENVSPMEVEACLKRNEMVDDIAVVGAPDPEYGELVYAYIVPRDGAKPDPDELKAWCKGKIATIKIPQIIEIVEAMPTLPTGKVDKKALKKMAAKAVGEGEDDDIITAQEKALP